MQQLLKDFFHPVSLQFMLLLGMAATLGVALSGSIWGRRAWNSRRMLRLADKEILQLRRENDSLRERTNLAEAHLRRYKESHQQTQDQAELTQVRLAQLLAEHEGLLAQISLQQRQLAQLSHLQQEHSLQQSEIAQLRATLQHHLDTIATLQHHLSVLESQKADLLLQLQHQHPTHNPEAFSSSSPLPLFDYSDSDSDPSPTPVSTNDGQNTLAFLTAHSHKPQDEPAREDSSNLSPDNLKLINGIGPFIERRLNELGITTFTQILQLANAHRREEVTQALGFAPERIEHDDWIGQANRLITQQTRSPRDTTLPPDF